MQNELSQQARVATPSMTLPPQQSTCKSNLVAKYTAANSSGMGRAGVDAQLAAPGSSEASKKFGYSGSTCHNQKNHHQLTLPSVPSGCCEFEVESNLAQFGENDDDEDCISCGGQSIYSQGMSDLSNEATDGNNSLCGGTAEDTTASDIEDEMSNAKVFAQAPCRETLENMIGMREELDSFVNTNLPPAILFIDEQASDNLQ